jgi:very-short-patch-repair endonuclease
VGVCSGRSVSPTRISETAIKRGKMLRRAMTDGERRLWLELKTWRSARGIHVRKQAPIGPFVADFAVHSAKLVIEVDGEHHATPEGMERDARRDAWFSAQGYRVLRITTGEIAESIEGCIEKILAETGSC